MENKEKKKPNFLLTLILGFFATTILYIAVNQYIIDDSSWTDDALFTSAYIDEVIVEEREFGVDDIEYYEVGIPVIKYEVKGQLYKQEIEYWNWSLDESITSSNPAMYEGDSVSIIVNPNDPMMIILEGSGEGDSTNFIGFIIWGGIGGLMMFFTIRRLRRRFSD